MDLSGRICTDYLCEDTQETGGSISCLWGHEGELGSWDSGWRDSYITLSCCDVWIFYHVHILPLQKKFLPGVQFSYQKVLKYPFHLVHSPAPSLEGPGIMGWDLGIGSSLIQYSGLSCYTVNSLLKGKGPEH